MGRQEAVAKAEHALHDQVNLLPRRQLLISFATLSFSMMIVFMDQNGISVTLPTIADDLDAADTISWAGTASLIANTMCQMLYGRLSDIFGRKTVFIVAMVLLIVADLLCGLSQNAAMFYVFRGVAGIGGGGVQSLALIIVSDIVTLEQRGRYQGIIGAMIGLGNVIGPFVAASLLERTTWRAFFWLLAPLGTVSVVLTILVLPSKPPTAKFRESIGKVDWIGTLLSSIGVIFLLIPISGGGAYFPWKSPMVISMLVIGSLSLVAFVIWEWKLAKLPMMPVDMYKMPVVDVLFAQSFLLGLVMQSYLYYLSLYFQNARQFSVMTSALLIMPMVGTQSVCSVISGQYISRLKRYGEVIVFGFGALALGAGLVLIYDRNSSKGVILAPLIVIGIGMGFSLQPSMIATQAHSPKSRRAVIIANRSFFRNAGGACGLAVSAAVLQARLRATLPAEYAHLASSTYSLPQSARHVVEVQNAYMAASRAVFIMLVPLAGICFILTAFIPDRGLEPIGDGQPAEGPGSASLVHGQTRGGPAAGEKRATDGTRTEGMRPWLSMKRLRLV